jgi:hypothetical protein
MSAAPMDHAGWRELQDRADTLTPVETWAYAPCDGHPPLAPGWKTWPAFHELSLAGEPAEGGRHA